MQHQTKGGRLSGFLGILYYEFLWNLRKKKTVGLFIIVFAIVTLQLALPPILAYTQGLVLQQDPTFVFRNSASLNGIFVFLLAVAATMNTISGEFETGSIIPLLTKPVSRTLVFTGKMLVAFLTLLAVYVFLGVYMTVGGYLTRGPQDNLALVPLGILGLTLGTIVWTSIVVALGTVSKNSIVAALGSFGFYIGLAIVGTVLSAILGQTSILFYTPGEGASGTTGRCEGGGGFGNVNTFPTGTNALGTLLMQWVLEPSLRLSFCGFRFAANNPETYLISTEPFSSVALRALGVSLAYIGALLLISWFIFRRAEIAE